jgi:adenylate cyclase
LKHLDTALRLSPRTRIGTSANLIGLAHLFARRFDQAVPQLILAIQDDPGFPAPYQFLAVCYGHLGRLDAARDIVVRLRGVTNLMMPDVAHFRNAEHRDLLLSGFRLAMAGAASGPAR